MGWHNGDRYKTRLPGDFDVFSRVTLEGFL